MPGHDEIPVYRISNAFVKMQWLLRIFEMPSTAARQGENWRRVGHVLLKCGFRGNARAVAAADNNVALSRSRGRNITGNFLARGGGSESEGVSGRGRD